MRVAQTTPQHHQLLTERVAELLAVGVEMMEGPLAPGSDGRRVQRRRLEWIAEVAIAETQPIKRDIALHRAAQALANLDHTDRRLPLVPLSALPVEDRAAYRCRALTAVTVYLESLAHRVEAPAAVSTPAPAAPTMTLLRAQVNR